MPSNDNIKTNSPAVNDVSDKLLNKFAGREREIVEKSYLLANDSLKDLCRENRHPFLEHPLNTALIVAEEMDLGYACTAAVFLHEASRVNTQLLPLISKQFPKEILNMVEGLDNISRITPKETRLQAENYRKLIVSYSTDPRVTLIKIADRLEVMRNLSIFPKSSQMRKLTETQMLYIPLAHQLGLYKIKGELENLYFRYSDPQNYRAISNKLLAGQSDRSKLAAEFLLPLEQKLKESGIAYSLKVRTKTAWSIWQKMQRQDVPFEGVSDVFAIRFILDVPPQEEKEACWQVYSLVTQEYKPDVTRLRDWISTPKANGYESLHTTVQNKDGVKVEVQIRTVRMDQIAESGHASHWSYKGIKSVRGLDEWLQDVKKMLETPGLLADQTAHKDLDEIFVFTPGGDLKQLPKGASVLDFAFAIHSNLGMTCSGAKVNGKIKSIREKLHTGDVVEIMSRKDQKPSRDWLNIVISSKARSHIKSRLNEEEGKMSRLGREILERRMKNWKLELTEDTLSVLAKHFKMKSIGDFLISINDQKINLQDIKDFLSAEQEKTKPDKEEKEAASKLAEKAGSDKGDYLVISDKLDNISYKMAKCCNPIFGDDVFGFVTTTGGISIHRITCPNASRLLSRYPYRIQKVRWKQLSTSSQFQTGLKVIGSGDATISTSIMECVTKAGASIRAFRISERQKRKLEFVAEMELSVGNKAHLDKVISSLKKIREVTNVIRTAN